ncbi:helix-turn-helix domain-containing protein [Streptomyces sp. NPDC018610]|uniref:helix-turn-helix domain-containing protein n=1 Tax=Streptomyces sp. NPDC018610 TaxID=3365049 RepID=UPI0037A8BA7F
MSARRAREAWRAVLSRTFDAVDLADLDETGPRTVRSVRLGHLRVVTAEGGPLSVRRTSGLIARRDDGRLLVLFLTQGLAAVEQDGHEAPLRPGEIVFCDLTRPLRLEFARASRVNCLVVPRLLLGLGEDELRRLTAAPGPPDTVPGALLAPLVTRLVDTAETYATATAEALARNVVDLLGVLAEERLHRQADDTGRPARVWLPRIQVFIDEHLTDPDLTPESIARAHRISVRYLHRLFQAEGVTVSRWIQRRRLRECRRELAHQAASDRTIAAVARRWGFASAAHFSRVFRAAYGMSPAEWRDSGTRTLGPAPIPTSPPAPAPTPTSPPAPAPAPSPTRKTAGTATALRPRRPAPPPADRRPRLGDEAGDTAA